MRSASLPPAFLRMAFRQRASREGDSAASSSIDKTTSTLQWRTKPSVFAPTPTDSRRRRKETRLPRDRLRSLAPSDSAALHAGAPPSGTSSTTRGEHRSGIPSRGGNLGGDLGRGVHWQEIPPAVEALIGDHEFGCVAGRIIGRDPDKWEQEVFRGCHSVIFQGLS